MIRVDGPALRYVSDYLVKLFRSQLLNERGNESLPTRHGSLDLVKLGHGFGLESAEVGGPLLRPELEVKIADFTVVRVEFVRLEQQTNVEEVLEVARLATVPC